MARWLRISLTALLFLSAAANLRRGVFEWGPLVCLGLMFLLAVDRKQGESLRSYLQNPRAILSLLLATCAILGDTYSLVAR